MTQVLDDFLKVFLVDPETDSQGQKQIKRAEPGACESLCDSQESPWKRNFSRLVRAICVLASD